jgi:hypothetical protein
MNEWGNFYPIKNELLTEVVEHFANVNNIAMTRELELFARDLWTECKQDQGGNV